MHRLTKASMYASVREYLQELAESGLEGVPPDAAGAVTETVRVPPAGSVTEAGTHGAPAESRLRTLAQLQEQYADCRRCSLAVSRLNLVFGSGNASARLLFVGEAPGAEEDRQGEPFAGEAGQILTRLIEAMGLTRQEVYITNLLKCRPPANRNPHKDEIEACAPILQQQVRALRPEVIVALGTFAAQHLLGSKEPISRLRGRFHDCRGIPLMPTFHPAFLLRNRDTKEHYWEVWNDMVQVLKKLRLPVPEKGRGRVQVSKR